MTPTPAYDGDVSAQLGRELRRSSRNTVFDARHKLTSSSGTRASFDFEQYQPHVTVTYAKPEGLDLATVEPFRGKLEFGPEIFEEVTEGWRPSEA